MLLVALVRFFTLCPLCRALSSPLPVYFSVCLYISLFVLPLPEDSSWQRNKESVLCILSVCSAPAAASPSVASNTHPHTHTYTHSPSSRFFRFPSSTDSALPTALFHPLPWKLEQLLSGRHCEWVFYLSAYSMPACVRVSARVWMQMSACASTFCPGLCVARAPDSCAGCIGARTTVDTVYQHQPHGSGLLLLPLPSLPVPPVPGLSPNMCHSGVWPGVLWRWLKEKSVATAGVATQSVSTAGRRKRINET